MVMSDLEVCPAPSNNGIVLIENRLSTTTSSFQSFPAVSNSISEQNWEIAERRTDEILCLIRPTLVSDNNRREVINYVHDLITASLGCEVFPYGSVPLKTYLPDGDIDLTAISSPNVEESLVADIHAVLKGEELNKCSQFEVKDVHCIDAEVKLLKCLVQNIVVDISFNQLGGLCTLCFLEQVDGLVGKNHLFKRSIILIKAWCYYESRILGAHHGLISTYALETLVLCIFHLFHSSLDGPLAVLYQFLDYFSKFDWENYCVSLNGPVCKSSLDVAAKEVPESGIDNLLLSEEFLQECADKFSVPSRGPETNTRAFPQKHLNIIDALKENNNLGRSVNRGNFYRICSAFKYGARKLGQILLLPHERLVDELNKFFANTLERHENQCWTDGQDGFSSNDDLSLIQHSETCCEDSKFLTSLTPDYSNKITRFRNDSSRDLLKVIPSAYKEKVDSSQVLPELNCTLDRNSLSGRHLAEEAKGVAIEILSSKNRYDLSSSLPLNSYIGISLLGKSQPALALCNEKIDNGNLHGRIPLKSVHIDDMSFALWSESKENTLATSSSFCLYGNRESIVPKKLSLLTPVPNVLVNSSSALREQNLTSILGSSERSKCLLDLSGNYESYFSSLLYGKCYYLSAAVLLNPRISHQSQHKSLQETVWQSLQLEPEAYSKMSRNGDLGHQFYPLNPSMPSNFAFSSDEKKKSRGIGTYFPNMNYLSNRDRLLSGRERSQARGNHGQLQRYRNGLVSAPTKMNLRGESQEEFPVLGNGKAQFSDSYQPRPSVWGSSNANDISHPLERHESPSHGHRLREVTLPEARTQPDSDTSQCDYSSSPVVPKSQCPKLSITSSQDRVKEQSYHLKNEVDFPPLSLLRMVKI